MSKSLNLVWNPVKIATLSILLAFGSACASSQTVDVMTEQNPVTVVDSIEMTRLIEPNAYISAVRPTKFNFSPDGESFVVSTKRGMLSENATRYELVLYNTRDVIAFVESEQGLEARRAADPGREPNYGVGRVLVRVDSPFNEAGIQGVRWSPDSKSLFFLGNASDFGEYAPGRANLERLQAFSIDIETGKTTQLTDHPTAVVAFDLDEDTGTVFYTAKETQYHNGRDKEDYVIGSNTVLDEAFGSDRPVFFQYTFRNYATNLASPKKIKQIGDAVTQYGQSERWLWLSPNGKYAITVRPMDSFLEVFNKYPPFFENSALMDVYNDKNEFTAGIASSPPLFQYYLTDIERGEMAPVFNAPTGKYFSGDIKVVWSADSKSVFLGNTLLPLDNVTKEERLYREQNAWTVEYEVETGAITRIADHGELIYIDVEKSPHGHFVDLSLLPDGSLELTRLRISGDDDMTERDVARFVKNEGIWQEDSPQLKLASPNAGLALSIHQDFVTPPELMAAYRDAPGKPLTELNPSFRDLQFGNSFVFEWTDVDGYEWKGSLTLPTAYEEGTRYPLVIQDHGFKENRFLFDIGAGSPYVGRALSERGIIVLQRPNRPQGPNERKQHRLGIESAIDELDRLGLILRDKVGLIGFSATGHSVEHFITFSDYDIAAATSSDGYHISPMGYAGWLGGSMSFIESLYDGGVPWGAQLDDWVDQNLAFHLDLVRTPLRFESFHHGGQFRAWDTYAYLRRLRKPVEHAVFPAGAHNLVNPRQIYFNKQANVDWFDFWLNDVERTEPRAGTPETAERLREQYARWRKFKDAQPSSVDAARKAREQYRERVARREAAKGWLATTEGQRSVEEHAASSALLIAD